MSMGHDDLVETRKIAARVAQQLLSRGQKAEAVEVLTAWASARNDQEGHKLLAEALRHGTDSPLARAAFARMEGLQTDQSALDAARQRWSRDALERVDGEARKPIGGWQAEVGYNNNVTYQGQVFHIQTEDSGARRPHIITHLFADGGRILKSYKRSYAEHVESPGLSQLVRSWMKDQHKEMYIALREGRFDGVIAGREAGGLEVLEGAPNPKVQGRTSATAGAAQARAAQGAEASGAGGRAAVAQAVEARAESVGARGETATPAIARGETATPAIARGETATPAIARGESAGATATATPPAAIDQVRATAQVRARLHVIRALGDGPVVHDLRDDMTYVGRHGDVAVPGDPFVAGRHVKLTFVEGGLEIEDLGSPNGTFLRIRQPVELDFGDVFVAGDQMLCVEANPPPADGPDGFPTYFYSSPKWPSTFRVTQAIEGGQLGACVVARGAELQVGRTEGQLVFPGDYWLDGAHCSIADHGGFLMLTDHTTRGGTFTQLREPTRVTTGDELLVGRTRLRVELLTGAS